WSLLSPALDMAEGRSVPGWIPVSIGFMLGGIFLWIADNVLPHLYPTSSMAQAEGIHADQKTRCILLVFTITLLIILEGLAVGVAFGSVAVDLPTASLSGDIVLLIVIVIQNFPEGLAVSMPLRGGVMSREKSFMYGQ